MAKDLELSRPAKNILRPSPLTQEKDEQENKTKESKQPRELRTEPKPEIKPAAKDALPQPSPALTNQGRAELDEPKEERKLSEILAEARKRVSQTKPALGGQATSASPEPESITTTQKSIPPTSPTRVEAEPSDKTKPPTQKVTETRTGEVKKPDKTAVSPKTLDDLLPIEPSYAKASEDRPPSAPSSPTKPMGVGVPSNLPIGEPPLTVPDEWPSYAPPSPQPSLEATAGTAKAPEEHGKASEDKPAPSKPELSSVRPDPMDRQARKTPEEILGLPASPATRTMDGVSEKTEPSTQKITKTDEAKEGLLSQSLEKIVRAPERPSIKPPSQTRLRSHAKLNLRAMPILKFVIISGLLGVILLSVSYGIYWKLFLQEEPSAPPPPVPQISEPAIPQPLIDFRERRILEITSLEYDSLKPKLDTLAGGAFLSQSLIYIPIKHISDTERRFISLSEIFQILQIDAPPALLDPKNFTLYAYSPADEERELCAEAGIVDKSCYGPRLGIVMELWSKGEGILTRDTAASVMAQWEKTIINDIRPLILTSPIIPADYIPGEKFGINKYKNFDIRYKNFPIPAISIDWLISDKYLIIATSKNAARLAVDNLK